MVGFGLNVDQDREELPVPTATSLRLAGSATLDRDTVLRACLRALAVRYRQWVDADGDPRASGVGAAYREACLTLGLEVEVQLPGREPVRASPRAWTTTGGSSSRPRTAPTALAAGDVVHVRAAG